MVGRFAAKRARHAAWPPQSPFDGGGEDGPVVASLADARAAAGASGWRRAAGFAAARSARGRGGGMGRGGRGGRGRGRGAAAERDAADEDEDVVVASPPPPPPPAAEAGEDAVAWNYGTPSSSHCYSLRKRWCPVAEKESPVWKAPGIEGCVDGAADHADARANTKFCGERLPRKNPCWREGNGNVTCLPYIMVLGEMKCGTTSMYKMLSNHPQVRRPLVKEKRYFSNLWPLATASWYASNYETATTAEATAADAVTLDALADDLLDVRSGGGVAQEVDARGAVGDAADPVQRAYSHWRMGHNFLTASRCYREIDDLGGVRRVPGPRVLDVVDELTFPAHARLSMLEVALMACNASIGWGKVGGAVNISDATNECLQRHHMKHFLARVWNARQSWGRHRTAEQAEGYVVSMRTASFCSDKMLDPGATVMRSLTYATTLRKWLQVFPDSLRVVVLEELEADTDGVMAKVLSFVGLPPADVKGGGAGHACVHGKAGIMDDHPDPRLKTANFGKADSSGLAVGECGSETHKKAGKAGTKVYPIDANTTAQLQAYFAPHNAMLYKLLGRDLGGGRREGRRF